MLVASFLFIFEPSSLAYHWWFKDKPKASVVYILLCFGWLSARSQSFCCCLGLSFQFLNFLISIQYWLVKLSIYSTSDLIETIQIIYYINLVDISGVISIIG